MANIAGVESVKKLHGVLVNNNTLASCVPSDEVYTREDVLEIVKRFDWFKSAFVIIDDAERKDDSFELTKHFLEKEYNGIYWEGIDKFMGDK